MLLTFHNNIKVLRKTWFNLLGKKRIKTKIQENSQAFETLLQLPWLFWSRMTFETVTKL